MDEYSTYYFLLTQVVTHKCKMRVSKNLTISVELQKTLGVSTEKLLSNDFDTTPTTFTRVNKIVDIDGIIKLFSSGIGLVFCNLEDVVPLYAQLLEFPNVLWQQSVRHNDNLMKLPIDKNHLDEVYSLLEYLHTEYNERLRRAYFNIDPYSRPEVTVLETVDLGNFSIHGEPLKTDDPYQRHLELPPIVREDRLFLNS